MVEEYNGSGVLLFVVDDSLSSSEVMLFMVYVGKWSGGVEWSLQWMRVRCLMLVVFGPMMHKCARRLAL